jgi:hypothetical protein
MSLSQRREIAARGGRASHGGRGRDYYLERSNERPPSSRADYEEGRGGYDRSHDQADFERQRNLSPRDRPFEDDRGRYSYEDERGRPYRSRYSYSGEAGRGSYHDHIDAPAPERRRFEDDYGRDHYQPQPPSGGRHFDHDDDYRYESGSRSRPPGREYDNFDYEVRGHGRYEDGRRRDLRRAAPHGFEPWDPDHRRDSASRGGGHRRDW